MTVSKSYYQRYRTCQTTLRQYFYEWTLHTHIAQVNNVKLLYAFLPPQPDNRRYCVKTPNLTSPDVTSTLQSNPNNSPPRLSINYLPRSSSSTQYLTTYSRRQFPYFVILSDDPVYRGRKPFLDEPANDQLIMSSLLLRPTHQINPLRICKSEQTSHEAVCYSPESS